MLWLARREAWIHGYILGECAPIFSFCQIFIYFKIKFLFCQIIILFYFLSFFIFYHIKCQLVKYLTVSKKSLQNNGSFKKSPGSAAFVIYIANASVKGEKTVKWLAHCTDTSNVLSTTCGTKAFAPAVANTLEKAQMKKLSTAPEKGDKIFAAT